MIVEATGKVMQVLSKIEGVSAKTGKAWEKYTYLIEQSGMRPTSLVVSVFNYGEHVGELLNMGGYCKNVSSHRGAFCKGWTEMV